MTSLRPFLASLVCWLACWCAQHSAFAQELGRLFDDSPTLKLAAPVQVQQLPKGLVRNPNEFDSPQHQAGWKLLPKGTAMPTGAQHDVWLRFALPATAAAQLWLLRSPRISTERITLYLQDQPGQWRMLSAGSDIAPSRWPGQTRSPTFELQTRTDSERVYFVKLEHRTPLSEHLQLVSPLEYIDSAARVGTIIGLMFGLFGVLTVLGLATAYLYRNTTYAWYALMVLLLMVTQLVMIGYAGHRWWPSSALLNQTMGWIAPLCALASGIWFVLKVSYSKEGFRWIYRISLGLIGLLLAASVLVAVMAQQTPRAPLNVLAAFSLLWLLLSTAWIAWRARSSLWFVVLGLSPLVLSMLVRLVYNQGWLAHVELVQLVSVISGCLGSLVIYVGMVMRSRESHVALEREAAMNNTDAATGLTLGRIAMVRLPQVLVRSERFSQACGVVMVRWVDYQKQMQPLSAQQRGAVLLHLGARLRRLGRDIDTVARLDDDHFMYLIESPVSREALTDLGTKILTTCMRPARPLTDGDTYNVHVAIWASHQGTIKATEVMEALRTRLNQMSLGAHRRMQFVDSPLSTRPSEEDSGTQRAALAKQLVAKINAIEADPIIPIIATAPERLARDLTAPVKLAR